MLVEMKRFVDDGDTSGTLLYIDGKFECFCIEDEHRSKKIWGEMRFPEGIMQIGLRKAGGMNARFTKRYPWHKGMLCIFNAPNWKIIIGTTVFQYCQYHPGNDDDDTAGCPLPNETMNTTRMRGIGSTVAYKRMYEKIVPELLAGREVSLHVTKIGGNLIV